MSVKILIIDEVPANRIVLRVKLAASSYDPICATNANEGLALAKIHQPALVVCSTSLAHMSPRVFCREIRNLDGMADAGLILLDNQADDLDRARLLSDGADEILSMPTDNERLQAVVRRLLRRQSDPDRLDHGALVPDAPGAFGLAEFDSGHDRRATIAVVGATLPRAEAIVTELDGKIRDLLVTLTRDGVAGQIAAGLKADLFVLDIEDQGKGDNLRLLVELAAHPLTRQAEIVVIQDNADPAEAVAALDLGAADVVSRDCPAEELAIRLRIQLMRKRRADRQRAHVREGLRLAAFDPLTGLMNRRSGLAAMERQLRAAQLGAGPMAVLMLDLDRFKSVNDRYGHSGGDAVLCEVAERLRMSLRMSDVALRHGGEEFLIGLPATPNLDALRAAERLREAIEARPFRVPSGQLITVTVSIGAATSDCQDSLAGLIEAADRALFRAKNAGRNMVAVA